MVKSHDDLFVRMFAQANAEAAAKVASLMSVTAVVSALESDILPISAAQYDEFIDQWLNSLSPHQQLAAATLLLRLSESGETLAEPSPRSVQRLLDATVSSLAEVEKSLGDFPVDPESEAARAVRSIAARIASGQRDLTQSATVA